MRTINGKILLRFKKADIDTHMHKGIIEIIRPENPNDFSLEVAEVAAVSKKQSWLKPGDQVAVEYNIFMVGKFKDRVKTHPRLLLTEPNGDELYYAFDGINGWDESEVYFKIHPDGTFEMHPDWVLIEPPQKEEYKETKSSIILLSRPDKAKMDDKLFWTNILQMNPDTAKENNIGIGSSVLCYDELTRVVNVNKKEYYMIKPQYIFVKHWQNNYKPLAN